MDRLRLLVDVSHRTDNNAYNEMLSIIEECLETDLIKLHMHEMGQSSCVIEKKIFFVSCIVCITRRIMKKKSDEKREKISSERQRLIEELHASAKRNFPRRCVIV